MLLSAIRLALISTTLGSMMILPPDPSLLVSAIRARGKSPHAISDVRVIFPQKVIIVCFSGVVIKSDASIVISPAKTL
jgi:hypothetical protein